MIKLKQHKVPFISFSDLYSNQAKQELWEEEEEFYLGLLDITGLS